MIVVLLFLISSVFAFDKECIKSWYYFENPTAEQEQQALNDGCFYGTYGSIALLSCPYEDAKFLSNQYCDAKLCVVETPRSEELLSKINDKNTEVNRKDTEFLIKVGQAHVLSSVDGSYSCLDLDVKRVDTNVITVSEQAWKPVTISPDSFTYNLTAPDPTIASAVARVQASSIQAFITHLSNYNSRQSASPGAKEAQAYLQKTFTDNGFTVTTQAFRDGYSSNVIAEIRGDIPTEIIVIGAHYDSRGPNSGSTTQRAPGADDNASGTATLLELSRVIKASGLKFRRTIRLACFSGEEQGLVGSRAYASSLKSAGANVIAMLNGDMLGWKQTNQIITLGMMNRYVSVPLTNEVNAITKDYVSTLPVGQTGGCCSDQQSFTENGFPAVGYFENTANSVVYPHYHQSTDLPEYINQEQIGLEAKALIAAALTLARAHT